MDDLESLLADILDDSKPLPTKASVGASVVNAQKNKGVPMGDIMVRSPQDLLESIMNGEDTTELPMSPQDVADMTAVGSEMVLAEVAPQEPEESHSSVIFTDSGKVEPAFNMPTFTAADFAETMDIRNFATMVTLNTSRWHAKVKDRQAGRDAAFANDAKDSAFEVRKNLLAGADEKLRAIHKCIDEARAKHYELTLPWSTTSMQDVGRRVGGRLLPNTLFVEYTQAMADCKGRMMATVNAFIPEYPAMIELAKKALGKRFDAREYPNPSSIAQHFTLSFDFQPIPKGDDFKGLPQAQLSALARKVNSNTQTMAENAMQELWVRMLDGVSHMAERLSDVNKKFHDSLVNNVRDMVRVVPHLNITRDTLVEGIRFKIEKHLCTHDAKVLREKPDLRKRVAAMAVTIMQEMQK